MLPTALVQGVLPSWRVIDPKARWGNPPLFAIKNLSDRVSAATPRLRGRFIRPITAAIAITLIATGIAAASTPVTDGYRDQSFGGGAIRPTSDKPQSKLWYTDGQWFAGMFLFRTTSSPKSEFRIHRLDKVTHSWIDMGVPIDTRDQSNGDYLFDGNTLWVASAYPTNGPATIDDGINIFKYTYDATANTYTPVVGFTGTGVTIPGTRGGTPTTGGSSSVTIDRDSTGRLWAAWSVFTEVRYSTSVDGGLTWTTPVKVPTQGTNTVKEAGATSDIASVIDFGANVGIGWSDHDGLPTTADNGYYFSVIAVGADPTVAGNWSLEKLPTLVVGAPNEVADDHLNFKAHSNGSVYMVGKTGKDTAGCLTNQAQPLVPFFRRTAAGVWSTHLVGTVGDCNTRPQIVISEQLNTVWVFLTSPNGGGVVYSKSAPLTGPGALVFRGTADTTIQRGTPFIRSATETAIDDPTTGKQPVTAASGIVVLANNLRNATSGQQSFYLHNEMSIPATDTTAPAAAGPVLIKNGSAHTATTGVNVGVAATDAGSGVSLVRLSNSSAMTGDVLTSGQSYNYLPSIPWLLPAGDGLKTVYVQWRDASGNWSAVVNDTITLDTTAPTGTVLINGGAAATTSANVTLNLSATDAAGGSGVHSVLISNSADFSGSSPIPYATTVPWTLSAGDGTKTVRVRFVDAVGNTSAAPVSDTINLDAPPTGTVLINGGKAGTKTAAVSLTFPNTASDVTHVRAASPALVGGEPWQAYSPGMTLPITLGPAGQGTKTVQAQFRDGSGTVSSKVSDTIVLDTTVPARPSVPAHSLSNPVSAKVNVHLAWTGTDTAGSKFASYAVRQSVDGGGFTILGYPTTGSFDVPVDPAKNYVFQVATIDGAGNVSPWATSATIRAENHAETSAAIAYTGSWTNQTLTSYMGGTAKASSAANATATLTFTGKDVAWLSRLSNINGTARVYIDNVLIATVNTFSSATQPKRVVFTRKFSTAVSRKLKVVVTGTPTANPRVTIDQFFVLK